MLKKHKLQSGTILCIIFMLILSCPVNAKAKKADISSNTEIVTVMSTAKKSKKLSSKKSKSRKKITIKLNPKKITLDLNRIKIAKLKATKKGTTSKIRWTSSNPKIATVNSQGTITAKSKGSAIITARIKNVKATCKVTVTKLPYVTKVSCGGNHTAFLKSDGTLYMTGRNIDGELGLAQRKNYAAPVKIMTRVKDVSCGGRYTAVVRTDGSLWMFGSNIGQLGTGDYTQPKSPVKIMTGVKSVEADDEFAAVIKNDNSLWTCGSNRFGKAGLGEDCARTESFKQVTTNVAAVSLGFRHMAILKKDGSLWMTGNNYAGQLCTGKDCLRKDEYSPVKVMDSVKKVSCGADFTAIIKKDGSLWLAGSNSYGQFGIGTRSNFNPSLIKVATNVKDVKCKCSTMAIIKTDNSLWMSGENNAQFGNGTDASSNKFVKSMRNVTAVSISGSHAAVIHTSKSIYTMGNNNFGQLGNGTKVTLTGPMIVISTTPQKIFS